jgi:hypothetical protein
MDKQVAFLFWLCCLQNSKTEWSYQLHDATNIQITWNYNVAYITNTNFLLILSFVATAMCIFR